MKITTKTGDNGETSLFGGRRVRKSSLIIELVGELDELQSVVGWARCGVLGGSMGYMENERKGLGKPSGKMPSVERDVVVLNRVQDDIYRMMSIVGFEMKCPKGIKEINAADVRFLEEEAEKRQDAVATMNAFIRPGSTEAAARLHIARTVCRRVERRMVSVINEEAGEILKYLNRLSDLLFTMAYGFEKQE